jgi:DNA-binding Xre family transcriptional regulator
LSKDNRPEPIAEGQRRMMWPEKILFKMSLYPGGDRELAARLGIAYTTLYRFKKGEKSLALDIAERVCQVVGLDLVEIVVAEVKQKRTATKKAAATKKKPETKSKKKTTPLPKKTTPKKPRARARKGSGSAPENPSVPDPSENGESPDDSHAPTNVGENPFTTFNTEERIKRLQSMDHEIGTFLDAGKEEEDPHTWKEI